MTRTNYKCTHQNQLCVTSTIRKALNIYNSQILIIFTHLLTQSDYFHEEYCKTHIFNHAKLWHANCCTCLPIHVFKRTLSSTRLTTEEHNNRVCFGWDKTQNKHIPHATRITLQHSLTKGTILMQSHFLTTRKHTDWQIQEMLIHNEGIPRLFQKHYIYVTISYSLEPQ